MSTVQLPQLSIQAELHIYPSSQNSKTSLSTIITCTRNKYGFIWKRGKKTRKSVGNHVPMVKWPYKLMQNPPFPNTNPFYMLLVTSPILHPQIMAPSKPQRTAPVSCRDPPVQPLLLGKLIRDVSENCALTCIDPHRMVCYRYGKWWTTRFPTSSNKPRWSYSAPYVGNCWYSGHHWGMRTKLFLRGPRAPRWGAGTELARGKLQRNGSFKGNRTSQYQKQKKTGLKNGSTWAINGSSW